MTNLHDGPTNVTNEERKSNGGATKEKRCEDTHNDVHIIPSMIL